MTIKKFGHSCLLVNEDEATILIDPGSYSSGQNEITGIDAILITHEHADHFDLNSVKSIIANNPQAKIYTVPGVGALLEKEGIAYSLLEDKEVITVKGVTIKGYGQEHITIYPGWPIVDNTGYCIGDRLWYPGDAFTVPEQQMEILALPVAGPWMKISEAIEYAKKLRPKVAFPVHDGILKQAGMAHRLPEKFLSEAAIEFKPLLEGEALEI